MLLWEPEKVRERTTHILSTSSDLLQNSGDRNNHINHTDDKGIVFVLTFPSPETPNSSKREHSLPALPAAGTWLPAAENEKRVAQEMISAALHGVWGCRV